MVDDLPTPEGPPKAQILPRNRSRKHEPVCGVKDAVAAGKISASRYESYLTMLAEVKLLQEKEGRK